jgi:hypothetical protein
MKGRKRRAGVYYVLRREDQGPYLRAWTEVSEGREAKYTRSYRDNEGAGYVINQGKFVRCAVNCKLILIQTNYFGRSSFKTLK